MPFIRVQNIKRNENGKIVSGSASIIDVKYVKDRKHHAKQVVRENLGKTRTDMDKLLNQCRGLYGKWERGGAKPYRKSVEKLLGFLNDNN